MNHTATVEYQLKFVFCIKTKQKKPPPYKQENSPAAQKHSKGQAHSTNLSFVAMSEMFLIIRGKKGMAFLLEASFTL